MKVKIPFLKSRLGKRAKAPSHAADRAMQSTLQQRRHILTAKSDFYTREAYKALRTNITFSVPKEGCRKICVTSAIASEGKSITCLNLALSFAEAGLRVLLIDADLRKPNQARLLEKRSTPGLSNLLAGLCTTGEAITEDVRKQLDVIFSGDIPPNPSELLGSDRMASLLDELTGRYDYIFIDTPPVNVVTDASVMARLLDGVVFVVRQGESERDLVGLAIGQLQFAGAKILGFVLNGVKAESNTRYGKYGKYKKYRSYRNGYRRSYGGYGYGGYSYGGYGYYGYGREHRNAEFRPSGEQQPPMEGGGGQ